MGLNLKPSLRSGAVEERCHQRDSPDRDDGLRSICVEMWSKLVLLVAFAVAVHADTTSVQTCTSNPGDLPLNTYIVGCVTPPCELPQLQDAVINIIFRADRVLNNMRTLATAYLSVGIVTIPINYDLQENAITCHFLTNTYCPVLEGEVVQYTLNMFIMEIFPVGTSVTVEFRVVDEAGQPVLCIRMPITVTPPAVT
ncbi:hypothetical protein EVAR_65140_1 [Eumeta japonica]|uniref:MD-2-related lipid-recognition domain-containing protein n=1 Tax=Eumeta variegata TaxID=151549 RepID=A0A4C1ZWH4_EUMVA|nr:hypothetical protein EVAR_65140_1 [Eumeta japonica]